MWSPVDHLGRLLALSESAAEFFPEAGWQRCIVHFYRNIFSHVPSTKAREIAAMLKAIHAGEDIVAARQKAVQVIEKLRGLRLTRAAELVAAAARGDADLLRFPRGALAAYPHQQPTGAHPARDQAAHPCRRRIPGRAISAQSRRGQVAPYRRHCLVDQTLLEHRAAEGPADERCHHRLSQCRAPLSPTKCAKNSGHYPTVSCFGRSAGGRSTTSPGGKYCGSMLTIGFRSASDIKRSVCKLELRPRGTSTSRTRARTEYAKQFNANV